MAADPGSLRIALLDGNEKELMLGESGVASRYEALRSGTTPLVGRNEEIDLLLRRWQQAQAGEGRVVLISGEGDNWYGVAYREESTGSWDVVGTMTPPRCAGVEDLDAVECGCRVEALDLGSLLRRIRLRAIRR